MTKQMTEQMVKQAEAFNKQMADWAKAAHTAGSKALSDMVSQASTQPNVDEKTKAKLSFSAEQMISATNPQNFFAFNPRTPAASKCRIARYRGVMRANPCNTHCVSDLFLVRSSLS